MNHRLGLTAWRWLFIFDFIIGIPVALFGFFCCPGTYRQAPIALLYFLFMPELANGCAPSLDEPKSSKMWWMTDKEHQMCIKRIAEEKRDAIEPTWDFQTVKRLLSCWQLYAFCISWG